jgi:YVTN family beta-propeller protein
MTHRIRTALALAAAWALLSTAPSRAGQLLYVSNFGNNTVSQIDSAGNVSTFASSGLSSPAGLAFDAAGNLYVANNVAGTVSEFSATGASMGTFASGLSGPEFLAFAPTLSAVPEPGALTLAGIGLATLLGYGRLRCRRAAPAP